MIEIGVELARFKAANQVWTIIKRGWFSNLKILEILQEIYRETCHYTTSIVNEPLNTEMPETSHQKQRLSNNNQDTTHPNTEEKILTQEGKINVEIMKRIVSEKKTPQCLLIGTSYWTTERSPMVREARV